MTFLPKTSLFCGRMFAGAVVCVAVAAGTPSAAQEQPPLPERESASAPKQSVNTSLSELDEDEFGDMIRRYLMENPEVVIEAINKHNAGLLAAKDERIAAAISENLPALLDPATSYVAGKNPAKAEVAIVELYDYHCSFCKMSADFVKELATSDESVKVIFRELPILRPESEYAAAMALASRDQGKFFDFHFALMEATGVLTKKRVHAIARKVGLDVQKMETAQKSETVRDTLSLNLELARAVDVTGTPTLIVTSVGGDYVAIITGHNPDELLEAINMAKEAGA